MSILKELALADFEVEVSATRRVLERLPDENLGWKPHAKSTALGELAAHIVTILGNQVTVLTTKELDFAGAPPPSVHGNSRDAILRQFEANLEKLRAEIASVDETELTTDWTLRVGDHVIFTRPKIVVLRSFGLSHIAHHRGQLTVYLRLLDIPLPSVYGPTADEG